MYFPCFFFSIFFYVKLAVHIKSSIFSISGVWQPLFSSPEASAHSVGRRAVLGGSSYSSYCITYRYNGMSDTSRKTNKITCGKDIDIFKDNDLSRTWQSLFLVFLYLSTWLNEFGAERNYISVATTSSTGYLIVFSVLFSIGNQSSAKQMATYQIPFAFFLD